MRILHICIACAYIEGWGYQENLLPKYQKRMGHDIYIVTSNLKYDNQKRSYLVEEGSYINSNGFDVCLLSKNGRFGRVKHLYKVIEEIKPEIIFVHGGQFVSLKEVVRYKKRNMSVKLFIDQHGDYYNMPVDTLGRRLVQELVFGHYIRKASGFVEKFWGTTPWRCEYLNTIYKVPKEKIDLLVMGADDEQIDFENKDIIRRNVRDQYHINKTDFLVITGGKINKEKNVHILIEAIKKMNDEHVKLLLFGEPDDEMREYIESVSCDEQIINIGWIESEDVYNYFLAADLAVFPGTHSVLWEQACACGLPAIFKSWSGMHHVDLGGNAKFLYSDSAEEITDIIDNLISNQILYNAMADVAKEKCVPMFSYSNIAIRSIET